MHEELGGIEAPGALEVARFPITSVVPVCVVLKCVHTSVAKCVLQRTYSAGERRCVRGTTSENEKACVDETPGMSETPGVKEETPCVRETPCVSGSPCMSETPRVSVTACVSGMVRVSEAWCVRETACVRSLYVREMTVGMREHAAASPGVNVMEWRVSVVTRRCAWVEWR